MSKREKFLFSFAFIGWLVPIVAADRGITRPNLDTLVYVAMGRDLYSAEVIGQDQTVGSLQAAGLAALATINDVINDACDELLEKVKKNDDLYRGPTN